jgi:hypothetical protein
MQTDEIMLAELDLNQPCGLGNIRARFPHLQTFVCKIEVVFRGNLVCGMCRVDLLDFGGSETGADAGAGGLRW